MNKGLLVPLRDDFMKSIYQRAYEAFYAEPSDLSFLKVCEAHASGAFSYVVRTEEVFILARQVDWSWPANRIVDCCGVSCHSDHLHVTLAVGELKELAAMIPEHIKTISFQKRGYRLRKIPVKSFKLGHAKADSSDPWYDLLCELDQIREYLAAQGMPKWSATVGDVQSRLTRQKETIRDLDQNR